MTWRQSRRLKLFLFLWLPAACFGQDVGGSRADSNPLNAYAPPCISQVKQNIAVSCQITPTGGTQPYSYAFTGSSRDVYVHGFGWWLDQWDAHGDNW
jgi:hypothetical protein